MATTEDTEQFQNDPVGQLNHDIETLVNDYSKPEWTVTSTTIVHADSEEEAIRLAKIDFAFENWFVSADLVE